MTDNEIRQKAIADLLEVRSRYDVLALNILREPARTRPDIPAVRHRRRWATELPEEETKDPWVGKSSSRNTRENGKVSASTKHVGSYI